MSRLLAPAVLALALVSTLGGVPGQVTSAGGSTTGNFGVRLDPAPGGPPANPLSRLYVLSTMAAGTSVTRSFDVLNATAGALDIVVYPAAATVSKGKFTFAPGRTANQLSSWTSVTKSEIRVPAGGDVKDAVTIAVPQGASSGTRTAVVWAQVSSAGSVPGGVTLINRVGVRLYISVGMAGPVSANFVIGSISAARSSAGALSIASMVRNVSKSTFDVSGSLTFTKGPGGLSAGPFAVTAGSVLSPGSSEKLTVPFRPGIPRGPWRAHLFLTNGIVSRSADATVLFPMAATGTVGFGVLEVVVIISVLVLFLLGIALALGARRRRLHPRGAASVDPEPSDSSMLL